MVVQQTVDKFIRSITNKRYAVSSRYSLGVEGSSAFYEAKYISFFFEKCALYDRRGVEPRNYCCEFDSEVGLARGELKAGIQIRKISFGDAHCFARAGTNSLEHTKYILGRKMGFQYPLDHLSSR